MHEAQPIAQLVHSNVQSMVVRHEYLFETLWSKSKPFVERIKEVEEREEEAALLRTTEIIQNPRVVLELFIKMVKSAEEEILLIFPTINSFFREERSGIVQLLKEVTIRGGINIKIKTPLNDAIRKILQDIAHETGEIGMKNFQVRGVDVMSEETSVTTATIMVVDKKSSLVIEQVDDLNENFVDAIGSASYSNSKPTVSSYVSIFWSLWNQAKLYEQLKKHDKMQQEFINIASHEMKTPTQAILGYSKLIQRHPEKREVMIEAIARNANRLQRLTNDILDVTRIETQSLKLNKERVNLNELVSDIIEDYRNEIEKNNKDVKLLHEPQDQIIEVEADKNRLTQVISNLLNNAIKFTKEGTIRVTEEVNDNKALVSIKDTGQGIDPEIFPRLFLKFAAKSETGTGLGLFISKSIVEALGGKIWAENNYRPDGQITGATFTFSIPLSKVEQDKQKQN